MLVIHNDLSKRKERFRPIDPKDVRMYVCGMTVYDYCHLGHARVLVVFDVVYRYLCHVFGVEHVTYVRNITDVDDKIIQRAQENREDMGRLTARYIEAMHEDAAALGVLEPDVEPRATAHMDEIIAMIRRLVEADYAYQADNGDVYYDVSRFEHYGRLSGKRTEDLRAGARVEVDEAKDDPLDFVLWKAAKPGEPQWDSPWGPGRPGWHIECSAMSTHCLGAHFDIHGGGMDLTFPHHENEIAQSEAATGEPFVNVWMHNGFVRVDEEKMSKSLGNFFTIREVLRHLGGEADRRRSGEIVRYFILQSHYRSPLNYTPDSLEQAKAGLSRLYTALEDLPPDGDAGSEGDRYWRRFNAAMDDDFNTALAISVLHDLARDLNKARDRGETGRAAALGRVLRELGEPLGLLQADAREFLQGGHTTIETPQVSLELEGGSRRLSVDEAITLRLQARARKDWATADAIRDQLQAQGIALEDGAGGTRWRRV